MRLCCGGCTRSRAECYPTLGCCYPRRQWDARSYRAALQVVLSDAARSVRTAGDALSDLGDARASGTMCQALEDSKLMRWRRRFLNEELIRLQWNLQRAQQHESDFDVQMLAAIERIEEKGGGAQMPMWMRIPRVLGSRI